MPETTHNSIARRDAWAPAELLAQVVASPHHPYLRDALRKELVDGGVPAEAIEKELDAWTLQAVRLLAALLAASTDES